MLKSKLQAVLGLVILMSAPGALAQRGGVSGPVTAGALNPASGATSVTFDAVLNAQTDCYAELLTDMMAPFVGTLTPPATSVGYVVPNNMIDAVYSFSLANTGPLPTDLKNQCPRCTIASMRLNVPDPQETYLTNEFPFELYTQLPDSTHAPGSAKMAVPSFPQVGYTNAFQETFSPITHVSTGGYTVSNNLTKVWQGQTPVDPAHIPLFNNDASNSQTNFRINGNKFFQCVESKL
jgi:hypothetical protein